MFPASYFVNWTYQNSQGCTVVVGEATEEFPASKATSLEFVNKSLARPHQSLPTIGTGKEKNLLRLRRSVDVVDGHASSISQSVPTKNTSNTVNMHDITTPTVNTVSLAHGVDTEEITTQSNEDNSEGPNNAFVSVGVDNISVNNGDLTINNKLEILASINPTVETTTGPLTTASIVTSINNPTSSTTTQSSVNNQKVVADPIPLEVNSNHVGAAKPYKDEIAYNPDEMQADAFPSIRSYGIEKLQFFKFRSQLDQVKEVLHIFSNESGESDANLEKFHYDSENTIGKNVATTSTPTTLTTFPVTKAPTVSTSITETSTSTTDVESTTSTTNAPITISTEFPTTTNKYTKNTDVINITTTQSYTASNEDVVNSTTQGYTTNNMITSSTTTEKKINEMPTVNTVDTKVPDVTNPKHVLINLTISADNAESTSYKPLYSLTLTVPTVGDSNEIPTVKITPMDVEPTNPTNFNKPATLEGTKGTIEDINWGGSCECSCPACTENTTDDFYDDTNSQATSAPPKPTSFASDDQTSTTAVYNSTEPTTEDIAQTVTTPETITSTDTYFTSGTRIMKENISTTDNVAHTTDLATETESEPTSTTEIPKFVCPKIEPPPILILEGEVTELQ